MNRIKLLVMDVDGTLTDGKINMSENGELFKSFNIKDGYGINEILPQNGILPVIITGRKSEIVQNRARELHIEELHQGYHDKLPVLKSILQRLGYSYDQVAYIGDDVLDLECMKSVGIKACPADAVEDVKKICDFISSKKGGDGAVRDFIEWLIKSQNMNI